MGLHHTATYSTYFNDLRALLDFAPVVVKLTENLQMSLFNVPSVVVSSIVIAPVLIGASVVAAYVIILSVILS
jgi:hypothetical protein